MAWEATRSLAPELAAHRDRMGAALVQLLEHGQTVTQTAYDDAQALARQGRSWLAGRLQGRTRCWCPPLPRAKPAGLAATGDPAFSRVWNLLGNPCVNVPGLFGPNHMPIGLQLVGHPQRERDLLAVASGWVRCWHSGRGQFAQQGDLVHAVAHRVHLLGHVLQAGQADRDLAPPSSVSALMVAIFSAAAMLCWAICWVVSTVCPATARMRAMASTAPVMSLRVVSAWLLDDWARRRTSSATTEKPRRRRLRGRLPPRR
jgi:hypothetical protein